MNENVIKGKLFEKKCSNKLRDLGFTNVRLTSHTDFGADIVAYDSKIKYVFQCKDVSQRQGVKAVQEVLGSISFYNAQKSVVISNSGFTPQAQKLARRNLCLLINGEEFINLSTRERLIQLEINKTNKYEIDFDIIKKFREKKLELGRVPVWRELDNSLRYRIRKKYNNYSDFLEKLGLKFNRAKPDNNLLKIEYKRIRKIIGKTPTGNDIKKYSKLPVNSFQEYPLTKLQLECGDRPNLEKNVDKLRLIEEFKILANNLGHYPSKFELDKFGIYKYSQYAQKWGNMKNFLSEAEIPITETNVSRKYNTDEKILILTLLESIISLRENIPITNLNDKDLKNFIYKGKQLIDKSQVSKEFGSIKKFNLEKLNSKIYNDIISKIETIKKQLAK